MRTAERWSSWRDAGACLRYERSRAATPWLALIGWLQGQWRRRQRWARMPPSDFQRLASAEALCAPLGLQYPAEDSGQCAPWHLPERFATLPAQSLPPHPVIDPVILRDWFVVHGHGSLAADALVALALQPLEPGRWQHLPLQSTAGAPTPRAPVAVCLHLFYPELWPSLWAQLRHIPVLWDLYVSVPSFATTDAWQAIVRDCPRVRFMPVPNRGRDVAPWLAWLRSGALDGYQAVCKLHGKRSPHMTGGDAWRDELLHALLGSSGNVQAILDRLQHEPALAMIGPAASEKLLMPSNAWEKNRRIAMRVAGRLGLNALDARTSFFAGTMFWFKPEAFNLLRSSSLDMQDFPIEMGQTEGTLAHALERLLAVAVRTAGRGVLAWPEPAHQKVT